MNWRQFTNQVRTNMLNHDADQDYMELWSALEPKVDQLNRKKKKKRGFTFFLLISGISIFFMIGMYSLKSNFGISNNVIKLGAENQLSLSQPKLEGIKSVTSVASNKVNNIEESKPEEEYLNSKKRLEQAVPKFKTISTAKNRQPKLEIRPNISNTFVATKSSFRNNYTLMDESIISVTPTKLTQSSMYLEFDEVEQGDLKSSLEPQQAYDIDYLSIPPIEEFDAEYIYDFVRSEFAFKSDGKVSRNKFKPSVRLNAYVYTTNRVLSPKNSMDNTLSQIRDLTETPLETTQVEILVDFLKKGKFRVATGLSFTQIVERLNFVESVNTTIDVDGVEFQVPNLAGSLIDINGRVTQEFEQDTRLTRINRYRFVDIPVLLNYNHGVGEWNFKFEAGPYFNISLKGSGFVLSEQLEFQSLGAEGVLRNKVGISIGGSTRIERSIGNSIKLHIGPSYRWIPNSISHGANTVDQTYNLFGGSAGLVFKF